MLVKNRYTGEDIGEFYISLDADLSFANLLGANLINANLSRANLSRANLSDADLSFADLTGTNLAYANLRGANLTFAALTDIKVTWPKGWDASTVVRCQRCDCGKTECGYTDAKITFASQVGDNVHILHEGNGHVLTVTLEEAERMKEEE